MPTGNNLLRTFNATLPALPRRLADGAAQRRVAAAAAQLPANLTSCFYLECRLLGACDRLDLIVHVDAASRWVLASGLVGAGAAWQQLARFAAAWSDGGAGGMVWQPGLEALWLELDLPPRDAPAGNPALPLPRIFFDFARSEIHRQRAARAYADAVATAAVLVGRPPPRDTAESVARCFAALPASATLPYIGISHMDDWVAIRLCVAGVTSADLPRILHAIAWRGDIAAVQRQHAQLLCRLGATDDRIDGRGLNPAVRAAEGSRGSIDLLHLDLAPDNARVGIEVATARFERGALLDALVEEGLCDPARRGDLDAWPARFVATLPHQIWRTRTTRKVNHVKIVHDQDGSIETKAYLSTSYAFHPRPADRRVALPLHR